MLEDEVREAIVSELKRQAQIDPEKLKVDDSGPELRVDGQIDLDDLVVVVVGSVAGGP